MLHANECKRQLSTHSQLLFNCYSTVIRLLRSANAAEALHHRCSRRREPPLELRCDMREMRLGHHEHACIDVAAQGCGPAAGPIGTQQPLWQQWIAQMQAAVFVYQ